MVDVNPGPVDVNVRAPLPAPPKLPPVPKEVYITVLETDGPGVAMTADDADGLLI